MRAIDLGVVDRPGSLKAVRRRLADLVGDTVDEASLDSALVVVSELVTNANTHSGDGGCRLRVVLQDEHLRIEVIDSSPQRPRDVPEFRALDAEAGRGLVLVAALARRWGSGAHRLGKCVWAELGTGGSGADAHSGSRTGQTTPSLRDRVG